MKKIFFFSVITILISFFLYWFFLKIETIEWNEQINTLHNQNLKVSHTYQGPYYHGSPHIFGWSTFRSKMFTSTFYLHDKIIFKWNSSEQIVIFNTSNGLDYYIVSVDSDKKSKSKPYFSFYVFNEKNGLKKIDRIDFPKSMAIQNTDYNGVLCKLNNKKPVTEKNILNCLNTDFFLFPYQLTSHLWYYLETGIILNKENPSHEFLKKYKNEFIEKTNQNDFDCSKLKEANCNIVSTSGFPNFKRSR